MSKKKEVIIAVLWVAFIAFIYILVGSSKKGTIIEFVDDAVIIASEDRKKVTLIEDYRTYIPTDEQWLIGDTIEIKYSGVFRDISIRRLKKAINNWNVAVDLNTVEKIDIYWNYQSYCIERKDNPSKIENLITIINGEYTAVENIVNKGTGSGNELTIYDSNGNELFWCSIWELTDERFGLGNSEYKFAKIDEQIAIEDFIELLPVE